MRSSSRKRISWYFLELRVKDIVEDEGGIAIRSTRSRSPADIIGIFPQKKEIWLIQAKMGKNIPKKIETLRRRFKDLVDMKGRYKVRVFLYAKRDKRYQLIEL